MSDIRKGYILCSPLSTAQSGTAQWCYASRKGQEWFLKEFLSPLYPDEGIEMPPQVRARKAEAFQAFVRQKVQLYRVLQAANDGNLVVVEDFFRYGNHFNAISPRIHGSGLTVPRICELPQRKRYILLRTIVNNVRQLHHYGVVHADLKPTNIIVQATREGFYTMKLIDFDNSFLESAPPGNAESFMTDPVYTAPEVFHFLCGNGTVRLDHKLDVFALGILLHQMLSGAAPEYDREKYHYLFEVVLDGGAYWLSRRIHPSFLEVLFHMLARDPAQRPGLDEVYWVLEKIYGVPEEDVPAPLPKGSKEIGHLQPAGNL